MRVKELIEQLEAAPQNAEVKIWAGHANGGALDIADINLKDKAPYDEYGYPQKGKEVIISLYQ